MKKNVVIPLLAFLLLVVSCNQRKETVTSNSMDIAITPSAPQSVQTGARLPLKAACTDGKGEANVNPTWSVENNLGTFEPAQGKETTFVAGNASGTGKIYATHGAVRAETTVNVGSNCPDNNSGGGGSGGGGGGGGGNGGNCDNTTNASTYGLFSETFIIPGILLDTDSSRFPDGGCIGVWPDGQRTVLEDGTQPGEMTEGLKGIKCTVGTGGGWWLQFGSDAEPGLSECDVLKPKNMSAFNGGSLKFDVKACKDVLIELKWGQNSSGNVTLRELGVPLDGQWHEVAIPLSRFAGIDLSRITIPAGFHAAPGNIQFTYFVDNVRWEK